jgi:hypothetical protein
MLCESVETSKELRWKVVKAMLDEFPDLKQRIADYLKKTG